MLGITPTHAVRGIYLLAFLLVVVNPAISSGTNFSMSASPIVVPVAQGNQGTSTITTSLSGGFNSGISLSSSGAPSGTTVSFSPQTIAAPGAGNSTMTFIVGSKAPAGTYPITVTGSGGGIRQTVVAFLRVTSTANFSVSASPLSLSVGIGSQGTSTITTTISGGFNSDVTLLTSGEPDGVTARFSPNPIAAPGAGNSTMTFTVDTSTLPGTYPITVTATGGSVQQSVVITLTVSGSPNFSISASPVSLSVGQSNQGTSTITTTAVAGFNSTVNLSTSGVPTGATVSFNPSVIPAPGSGTSTMTITVGANTPVGNYPITVTGIGGGVTQIATVTLSVFLQSNFASSEEFVGDLRLSAGAD